MFKQSGAMSPRLTLIILGLMFFIPLSIAWMMYTGVIEFKPGTGVNKGRLIDPPVAAQLPDAFADLDLNERWVLVHPLPEYCDDSCQEFLVGLRQFHRALGRDSSRVALVLLAEDSQQASLADEAQKIYPEFIVIGENTGMLSQQFEELAGGAGVFVIDPLENIMMHYAPMTDANEILADMERLLRYAKTDRR